MLRTTDIYQFTDYRAFLSAVLYEHKAAHPKFTVSAWAKKLGLKAPTSINKILRGQRHPGPEIVDSLIDFLKLDSKRKSYFESLVKLSKARKNPKQLALTLDRLRETTPSFQYRVLQGREFAVIANWYYFAIRELARFPGFQEDPSWIAARLRQKVTQKQVKEAIEVLLALELLQRDKNGKLGASCNKFRTKTDIASEALKGFHRQMLAQANVAILEIPLEKREFRASTISIPLSKVQEGKELIRKFMSEFCDLMEGDHTPEEVYQLNIQMFPLTAQGMRS